MYAIDTREWNEIMKILRNAGFNGKITTFDHSCDSIYKKLF